MSSIKYLMYSMGGTGLFTSTMWKITEPDDKWLWFSRFALGIICLGIGGIINAIEKNGVK